MAITGLIHLVEQSESFNQILSGRRAGAREQMATGVSGSLKAAYIAALFCKQAAEQNGRPNQLLYVTPSLSDAERIAADLSAVLGEERVSVFPEWETLPHESATLSPDLLAARLEAMDRLAGEFDGIVVAPVTALAEKIIPPQTLFSDVPTLKRGEQADLSAVTEKVATLGYDRVNRVEGPGEFAVRGDILDVFPRTRRVPVRIEWFGDEIEAIRTFELDTQRSAAEADSVRIPPAREFLLPAGRVRAAADAISNEARVQEQKLRSLGRSEQADDMRDRIASHLELLQSAGLTEGMEQYKPHLYPDATTLVDFVKNGSVVLDEATRTLDQLRKVEAERGELLSSLLESGRVLPSVLRVFASWEELLHGAKKRPILYLSGLSARAEGTDPQQVVDVASRAADLFHGKLELAVAELRRWQKERYRTLVVLTNRERAEHIVEVLRDDDIPAAFAESIDEAPEPGSVVVTSGRLSGGFEALAQRMVVLTDAELFGRPKRARRVRKLSDDAEEGVRIIDFGDLAEGDYVVHLNHGIGRYVGVQTLEVGGGHRDYLVVKYAGEDKLYVPTDQVDLLQRYVGVDEGAPKLNKLGGNEWARAKSRVKESVEEMAQGLLELYAARETVEGTAFGPDTPWQAEFEERFPYEETGDQLRAIDEVKRDMERVRPMDRLLCGDVGYGKTEVAIRAVFKAVMAGKQVCFLVPTTILAQQHYRTFVERFEGYPVQIAMLSRFESIGEQHDILRKLQDGSLDVVIGTHRLLSKDVGFKDLGLVVVDEEQRFGVSQKERLKELRKSVDVLTLTATPIPRTLQMALTGARDMSVIETPPEGRYPIRTYVVEYGEEMVREAILRELARDGQVYFVFNRVQGIERMAEELERLVPEARIGVAHGQMSEGQLERVMLDFLDREYDVLLCTTIIETGMDISNVNTLIVYDAERLGLSQLYQLRGRVGRTNRVAYSYFTYRPEKILSEDAEKRLQAIKEFTELGSGFKIAMRDLEIRGAGNILGAEQHGFISSVGFELYSRLLDESIKELRGLRIQEPPEPSIDLHVDAYIPDTYVPDSQQKVEMYKKVAETRRADDVDALAVEMSDRFGEPTVPVNNLLAVARVKAAARQLGVSAITQDRMAVEVRFHKGIQLSNEVLIGLARKYRRQIHLGPGRTPQVKLRTRGLSDEALLNTLQDIFDALLVPTAQAPALV